MALLISHLPSAFLTASTTSPHSTPHNMRMLPTRARAASAFNNNNSSSSSNNSSSSSSSNNSSSSSSNADARFSLLLAIAVQGAAQSQRALQSFAAEARQYFSFREGEPQSIEEALMTVPNLETIPYRILLKDDAYQIREYETHLLAETQMVGQSAFGFLASSQAFNSLASYLFGKNTRRVEMEMTTPVLIQTEQLEEEKMEMTVPVLSQKKSSGSPWTMSFVLPSKYSEENFPLPDDPAITVRRVPPKLVAAATFSGYVTDKDVKLREQKLRAALEKEPLFKVKELAGVQIAQYNPPFTPPFMRCNEILIEVERRDESNK